MQIKCALIDVNIDSVLDLFTVECRLLCVFKCLTGFVILTLSSDNLSVNCYLKVMNVKLVNIHHVQQCI